MTASAPSPSRRAARCGYASACQRSDQSCSCVTSPAWSLPCLSWMRLRLPARLDHAGNFPAHRDVAQLVATKAELAENAARTAGELASIAQPRRARIARQLLQLAPRHQSLLIGNLGIAYDRQQLSPPLGVFLYRQAAIPVAVDDSCFRHDGL